MFSNVRCMPVPMNPMFRRPWDSLGCEDPYAEVPSTPKDKNEPLPMPEQPPEKGGDADVDDSSCWPESIREAA
jgi:hypothetical protein